MYSNINSIERNRPLVSICIPTRGRVDILKQTLESIYEDKSIDLNLFEVVVSDNSSTDEINILLPFFKEQKNLIFVKSESEGFMNSINALKHGKGVFLKLLNDYSYFFNNTFSQLINFFKNQEDKKNCISFTSNTLRSNNVTFYSSFDTFIINLSFYSSWSSAFCIRKEKFDLISNDIKYNKQFPHTSLLFEEYNSEGFIVNDILFFKNQIVPKKGGTDLFHDFAVTYLQMLEELLNKKLIKKESFNHIKKDLFKYFLVPWFYLTKIDSNDYSYYVKNTKERIIIYYSSFEYYKLVTSAYFMMAKSFLRKIFFLKNT
jgi:glycosyltransferase involved in cell wall biosynthesis